MEEIASKVEISEGSAHTTLTKTLGKKMVSWTRKMQRVDKESFSKSFKKNCDDRVISILLTGDETLVYMFEPQRRSDNMQG